MESESLHEPTALAFFELNVGFVSGSVVQAAGVNQTTTFVSSTQLQATVPVATGATTVSVDVVNPDPGGTTSTVVSAQVRTAPQVTVSGGGQVRLGSTAQFTATVTGETNSAVTWQVNGVSGGSAAVGTISAAGLYTPPATIPAANPVSITAVSVAAPT